MSSFTPLGPGTMELGEDLAAIDFSGEILGGKVLHAYEETGEKRTLLNGNIRGATLSQNDGLSFDLENDLTAAGLYAYCRTANRAEVKFKYTPNTPGGATWSGTVTITLPAEIGTDKFGNPIVSSVEWAGVGEFDFTPETTIP